MLQAIIDPNLFATNAIKFHYLNQKFKKKIQKKYKVNPHFLKLRRRKKGEGGGGDDSIKTETGP